jgi:hypothetical protein
MKRPKTLSAQAILEVKPIKLNLGSQDVDDFTKVKFDPLKFPWPLKDGSVEEILSPMCLNYITADKRGLYMDEIYRVLVPEGKAHIWVPYYTSMRAIQDYAATWPPFCESSFLYFNREWRKLNHPDRTLKCNFDFTFGYQADPETASKNDETRTFWIKHYTNAVQDLRVVMTKKA